MNWKQFEKQCMRQHWFHLPTRRKTLKALKKVVSKLPIPVPESLVIYAPHTRMMGACIPSGAEKVDVLLLLPSIEKQAPEYIEFVIAHEFSHLHLHRKPERRKIKDLEAEADKQAAKWGWKCTDEMMLEAWNRHKTK